MLIRPRGWPEAWWASLGAGLLVLCRLLSPGSAWQAVGKDLDVYLFLIGIMVMSELARLEGVFDWVAGHAVRASKGSRTRLLVLSYIVGVIVTVFLSNDATAVVLTPAVLAAVRAAEAEPLPYLLICAFIANAASFVLPISKSDFESGLGHIQLLPFLSYYQIRDWYKLPQETVVLPYCQPVSLLSEGDSLRSGTLIAIMEHAGGNSNGSAPCSDNPD